jgi:glutamine amidotransferase
MCRLLAVRSALPIDLEHHLGVFSRLCAESPQYQGHGWGCSVWRGREWETYRTIEPIWEDDFRPKGEVRLLLVHARSAFRDQDIVVENNMPFTDQRRAFLFNGELHGVNLAVPGRTGAARLFRLLSNFGERPLEDSIERCMNVIKKRTAHIRACNFILAEAGDLCVHTLFSGEEDYFTMYWKEAAEELVICSVRYPGEENAWLPLPNGAVRRFPC